MKNNANFISMNLGDTTPRAVDFTTVEVLVDPQLLLGSYAKAFVMEANRVAPFIQERVNLSVDEVQQYCSYLITQRVKIINGDGESTRKLKTLYIPAFIQYILSSVGIVIDRIYGLKLIPVVENPSTLKFSQAAEISERISMFIDKLQILYDAMPYDESGDEEVMASVLIDDTIRSYKVLTHPAATYASAFLGSRLRKDEALKAIYRISYDDVGFISAALITQKGIY